MNLQNIHFHHQKLMLCSYITILYEIILKIVDEKTNFVMIFLKSTIYKHTFVEEKQLIQFHKGKVINFCYF